MTNGEISNEMKSRLIRANLPATYEELVALAAGVGIPADILLSEEGWLQLPTYLNKANLLDDVTEEAIWGDAADRTVNAALKMLADVAYGRVATLNLTIKDTTGAAIPDVTVKLDSAAVVGTDPRTDENGEITISTNGGQHTIYLIYPMGYTVESTTQAVEISGVRDLEIKNVARSSESYFTISTSKNFYIARYLSPVQLDIRGGAGGGACRVATSMSSGETFNCQGGAGGYQNVQTAVDVAGKLIRAIIGAGGKGKKTTGSANSAGSRGGTTTVYIGDITHTAKGGAGGGFSTGQNTDGGAPGGWGNRGGATGDSINGGDGPRLFNDSSLPRKGAGGGGAYFYWKGNSAGDYQQYSGDGGKGGGTDGVANYIGSGNILADDATNASGGGACAVRNDRSGSCGSGDGGPGFVAFRKAV